MDDLELLEQALSTIQSQQIRLRGSVDESVSAARVDTSNAITKIDKMEGPLIAARVDIGELRKEIQQKEKESRQRFDSIAAVLKVCSPFRPQQHHNCPTPHVYIIIFVLFVT